MHKTLLTLMIYCVSATRVNICNTNWHSFVYSPLQYRRYLYIKKYFVRFSTHPSLLSEYCSKCLYFCVFSQIEVETITFVVPSKLGFAAFYVFHHLTIACILEVCWYHLCQFYDTIRFSLMRGWEYSFSIECAFEL